jgi:signal peptidase I
MLPNKETLKKEILDFLQSIIFAIGISVVLFVFIITPNEVEGSSMEPNFHTGERIYTNKLTHWFSDTFIGEIFGLNYYRGEVVVLQKPGMDPLIKRIIGLPGDVLSIREGKFFVNGEQLNEEYISAEVYTSKGPIFENSGEIIVPSGNYFVAGDNRRVSNDSRYIGFIEKEWIIGKPVFRVWPLDKAGILP